MRPEPDNATLREDQQLPAAPLEDDQPFGPGDYLAVNLLFLAFTWTLYALMRKIFPDTGGLTFFFVLLSFGFICVSLYDALFDRLYTPGKDDIPPAPPEDEW